MSATLNSLLEKTSNWDKDERYMATNDLCNELQKDIKVCFVCDDDDDAARVRSVLVVCFTFRVNSSGGEGEHAQLLSTLNPCLWHEEGLFKSFGCGITEIM